MSEQVAAARVVQKAEQGGTLVKLIFFSLSLAIVPLSSYFASQKYLWNGDGTYSAITAVLAANGVLVAYIIMSVLDDKPQAKRLDSSEAKKDR